jgi:hypothetical protein
MKMYQISINVNEREFNDLKRRGMAYLFHKADLDQIANFNNDQDIIVTYLNEILREIVRG